MHLPSRWPDQPCSHHPNRDHPTRVICRTPEKFWDESGFEIESRGFELQGKFVKPIPGLLVDARSIQTLDGVGH